MVVALLIGLVAGVVGWGRVGASAAPKGWTYGVELATPTGVFTMGHISAVVVTADELATTNSLADGEKAEANKNGKAVYHIRVAKTFGDVDRANFVGALAKTTLTRMAVFAYYNGLLVDHLRAAPVYVKSVDQDPPPRGSVAAVQETMEFVTHTLTRVPAKASVPVVAATPITDGIDYAATLTKSDGKTDLWKEFLNLKTNHHAKDVDGKLTPEEKTSATSQLGAEPVWSIAVEKAWDGNDNATFYPKLLQQLMTKMQLNIKKVVKGKSSPLLTYSVDKAFFTSISWVYPKPGDLGSIREKLTFTTDQVKETFVSPTA
jgi:hypothetical protein